MKSGFELFLAYKRLWAVLVILTAILFLLKFMSDQSAAQSPSAAPQRERVLESLIKKQLPIKVNIKKEKEASFKDLNNPNWLREFELEVINTGDKPIYFLDIQLISDVKIGGQSLDFPLIYGRPELGDVISKAWPEDVPIKPGESYVFKIHPGQIPAWEQNVRDGIMPDATKIVVLPQTISFGDGTGYFVDEPYPPARYRREHPESYPPPKPPDTDEPKAASALTKRLSEKVLGNV